MAITAGAVAVLARDGGKATLSAAGPGPQPEGAGPEGSTTPSSVAPTTSATPQVTTGARATTLVPEPVAPTPTTTTPTTTTPTTTAPPPPLCGASMVGVTAKADKASYRVGDEIVLHYEAANRSGRECLYPRYRLTYEVYDGSGQRLAQTRLDDPSPGSAYPDLPAFYYHALPATGSMSAGFGYPATPAGTLTFRISTETFGAAAPVSVTIAA